MSGNSTWLDISDNAVYAKLRSEAIQAYCTSAQRESPWYGSWYTRLEDVFFDPSEYNPNKFNSKFFTWNNPQLTVFGKLSYTVNGTIYEVPHHRTPDLAQLMYVPDVPGTHGANRTTEQTCRLQEGRFGPILLVENKATCRGPASEVAAVFRDCWEQMTEQASLFFQSFPQAKLFGGIMAIGEYWNYVEFSRQNATTARTNSYDPFWLWCDANCAADSPWASMSDAEAIRVVQERFAEFARDPEIIFHRGMADTQKRPREEYPLEFHNFSVNWFKDACLEISIKFAECQDYECAWYAPWCKIMSSKLVQPQPADGKFITATFPQLRLRAVDEGFDESGEGTIRITGRVPDGTIIAYVPELNGQPEDGLVEVFPTWPPERYGGILIVEVKPRKNGPLRWSDFQKVLKQTNVQSAMLFKHFPKVKVHGAIIAIGASWIYREYFDDDMSEDAVDAALGDGDYNPDLEDLDGDLSIHERNSKEARGFKAALQAGGFCATLGTLESKHALEGVQYCLLEMLVRDKFLGHEDDEDE